MPIKDPKARKAYEKTYQTAYYQANATRLKKANIDRKQITKERWALFKSTLKCANCGENHPATLDFHHVEKHPDNRHVYDLTSNGAYKKAAKEIEKCIVLCANCHRKVHYEEHKKKKEAEASLVKTYSSSSSSSSSLSYKTQESSSSS